MATKRNITIQQRTVKQNRYFKSYLFFVGLLISGFVSWYVFLKPMHLAAGGEVVVVKSGQTYASVVQHLATQKKLIFPSLVNVYRRIFVNQSLKAGAYAIPEGTNVVTLLNLLSQGKNAQMLKVTAIDGITFADLRAQLDSNPNIQHMLTGLSDTDVIRKLNMDVKHPEGWFAPDTYFFAQGACDLEVLMRLYQQQKNLLEKEWSTRAANLPYRTMYDALIMASIVEKETGIGSDRARIAGVFVSRLNAGMKLQTDPTVIYGMGSRYHGNITRQDLVTPTAYNTYTISGLPPTPIALPSKASIIAALHPDITGDLYFVASGIDGHTTFSKTLTQHNQAVSQYLKAAAAP